METIEIKYQDKLSLILDSNCEPIQICYNLPVIGEGNNRIVYDLGDRVLKVAKSVLATMYNQNENRLWKYLGEKSQKIKINRIFEIDENSYWYVAEKIQTGKNAMENVIKYIPWLDWSDNAGNDRNGKLTIIDAENVYIKDLEYLLQKGVI